MRIIYIFLSLLTFTSIASACDFCNCYLGLDPGYNKNTIGLRNSWRTAEWIAPSSALRTTQVTHASGDEKGGSLLTESFVETELFVRYSPISKLRLFLTVPYSINTLEYEGIVESRSAFADMTVMALYQVANTIPKDSVSVRHRFFAGGGIKFPTGKSEGASDVDIPMSEDLYSGTGSTDYLLNVSYIGKFKKLGWNFDASYKINGESATDYRYGNTLNLAPQFFYETNLKSVKLLPHISAAYEMGDEDEYMNETREETGGTTLWGGVGLDVYYGMFSITTDFRLPMYHDMGALMPEDKTLLYTSLNIHF